MKNMGHFLFFMLVFIPLFLIFPVTAVYSPGQYTKAECSCPALGDFKDDLFSYAFAGGGGVVCKFSDEDKGFAGEFRFQDFFPQNSDPAQGEKAAQSNFDSKARIFIPSSGSSGKAIFHDQQKQSSMVSYAIEYPPAVKSARPLYAAGKMHLIQDTVLVEVRGESNASIGEAISRMEAADSCVQGIVGSPQPVQDGEKTLHGTIIATKLPYGIEYPLKYAKLTLSEAFTGGERRELGKTTTDDEGNYEFGRLAENGKAYEIDIDLTYDNGKEYFSLYHGTAESESNKVVLPHQFTVTDDKDLEQDIDLDTAWSELGLGAENPYGIIYVHTVEALEFYRDELHEDINLNLPVKIIAFVPDATFREDIRAMYYFNPDSGQSAIAIGNKESGPRSEFRPVNREYHEFSHYMMTNMYGGYLDSRVKNATPVINHDGYVNPSTSDSWQEGFAAFMSVIIAEDYGYSCDGTGGFVTLDSSHRAWDYQGKAEEYAVAGVLYDLYDGESQMKACVERGAYLVGRIANSPYKNEKIREEASYTFSRLTGKDPGPGTWELYPDDDTVSLPIQEIWVVLEKKHPDFTSVYHGFIERYPEKKTEIDAVFLDHGFFIDRDPGNGNYDSTEPFRDANGNAAYDLGEFFIDMPSMGSGTGRPAFDRLTETIGTATNYERPWRLSTQYLAGHFVKVNNAVPFYGYTVEFPGASRPSYSGLARNNNGLVYVQVPPESGAKITVKAVGVTTGNPLVFTSDQFREQYMAAVKQGYYTSHDFKISGPVPTPPVTPDFRKSGPAGMKNAGIPDLLSPASRIPLIVSVPVAIAALLVLAYVLKKGE